MSGHPRYVTGTHHGETVEAALNGFHRALTRRWREVVCEAIVDGSSDYPSFLRRPVSPHSHQPAWDYWSVPARVHLSVPNGCAYVAWVRGGQRGPLGAVRCPGATDLAAEVRMVDHPSGQWVTVPQYIDCGLGRILQQVEDWAWGEREHVFGRLPLFDAHDVGALERAHDAFVELGGRLGLEAAPGSDPAVRSALAPVDGGRELPDLVSPIAAEDAEGQDWWTGWTGLAAARAKSGFFASVAPTLRNQAGIAGSLANLYSDRAAIIEKGRNDTLYWLQWATASLDETELVTSDRTAGWKVVQAIGLSIPIHAAWTGPAGAATGAAVGAAVVLVGFLGENLDPGTRTEAYRHGIEEVVGLLDDRIGALGSAIDSYEQDFADAVTRLRTTIHGIHSFDLELYDLTRNNPVGEGDDRGTGYQADIRRILRLAEFCYEAGAGYQRLLPVIAATSAADRHLADRDGNQTPADRSLLEVRDQLEAFLRTSCGRYLLAGDQVREAARDYADVEEELRTSFHRVMGEWETEDVGDLNVSFDPARYAAATDRSGYDPYAGHPARGGGEPGAGDGENYVIEGE